MANINLPVRLREPFESISGAMLQTFPEGVVAMGGGSMLEALWNHRVSTDIDLFIAPANLREANRAHRLGLYPGLIVALLDAGASISDYPRTQQHSSVFMAGHWSDGTPWSLATMAYANPEHPMYDRVHNSGIRAASLTEIFMGKIAGRFAKSKDERLDTDKQNIPIRDCCDVCVGAAKIPGILQRIIEILPPEGLARICDNLLNTPADLHLRDNRPVVDPKWDVELENVAPRIGKALISKDIGLVPAAREKLSYAGYAP